MAFSDETKRLAFNRAGGRCENENCGRQLSWLGNWHAHHKHAVAAGGPDTLSNCQILCIPCHENTRTYGR